ncbi:LLM class flavin-dependent oxidoreductase [Streptomyces sp. L7]
MRTKFSPDESSWPGVRASLRPPQPLIGRYVHGGPGTRRPWTLAEWADGLGCTRITVSEHHGSPDGYLPSPVQMLAAMAARTEQVRFLVAAST